MTVPGSSRIFSSGTGLSALFAKDTTTAAGVRAAALVGAFVPSEQLSA